MKSKEQLYEQEEKKMKKWHFVDSDVANAVWDLLKKLQITEYYYMESERDTGWIVLNKVKNHRHDDQTTALILGVRHMHKLMRKQ